ncbi:hypothetical protein L596_018509 [Steinernema carpocapsae]|uniref:Protein kinase domain-containing protein n=1 Tax=Steinernema carpocapsae TaxID=34508 RepID=A0A4U5N5W9_STECR|nr:hypothetical protein L596_018509 [Steinernema carpocapsae]
MSVTAADSVPTTPSTTQSEQTPKDDVAKTVQASSGNCYKILEVIGKGGFGMVHRAIREPRDRQSDGAPRFVQQYAVKTEQESSIFLEVDVLSAAQNKVHFCKLWDQGQDPQTGVHYIVMSLLGPNLVEARNDICGRRFSLSSVVRIAMQTLHAIEELHSIGFLSRDVKPSNFALGRINSEKRRLIYMLDFGIARRYVDKYGVLLPERESGGWRGTSRYCSLNIHRRLDQSRRDDVESWFYMVVELTSGHLIWGHLTRCEKPQIENLKALARSVYRRSFLSGCPSDYNTIFDAIDRWGFKTQPDYCRILVCLMRVMKANKIEFDDPYDWELSPEAAQKFDRRKRAPRVVKDEVGHILSYVVKKK